MGDEGRKRAKKVTEEQKRIVVDFLFRHKNMLTCAPAESKTLWLNLVELVEACDDGPKGKTIEEWKKIWQGMKRSVKDKVSGSGPKRLTNLEEQILHLMGETMVIDHDMTDEGFPIKNEPEDTSIMFEFDRDSTVITSKAAVEQERIVPVKLKQANLSTVVDEGRKRAKKITHEQKEIMVDFLFKHGHMTSGTFSSYFTPADNKNLWSTLVQLVDACEGGPKGKSIDEWKRSWQDMRRKVKEKVNEIRKHPTTTRPKALTELEERILKIMEEKKTMVVSHDMEVSQSSDPLLEASLPVIEVSQSSDPLLEASLPVIEVSQSSDPLLEASLPVMEVSQSSDPLEASLPVIEESQSSEPTLDIPVEIDVQNMEWTVLPNELRFSPIKIKKRYQDNNILNDLSSTSSSLKKIKKRKFQGVHSVLAQMAKNSAKKIKIQSDLAKLQETLITMKIEESRKKIEAMEGFIEFMKHAMTKLG